MKPNIRSVALFVLLVPVLCLARVATVVAAPPTAAVTLVCADYNGSQVVFYSASAGAPGQTSGASCATQLALLQNAGFTNVNITVQTYVASGAGAAVLGAPGQVNGTYTTYVLANGTLSSGNL